jgi:hypothetical protein
LVFNTQLSSQPIMIPLIGFKFQFLNRILPCFLSKKHACCYPDLLALIPVCKSITLLGFLATPQMNLWMFWILMAVAFAIQAEIHLVAS